MYVLQYIANTYNVGRFTVYQYIPLPYTHQRDRHSAQVDILSTALPLFGPCK